MAIKLVTINLHLHCTRLLEQELFEEKNKALSIITMEQLQKQEYVENIRALQDKVIDLIF